jgi:SAM-dependent methyltransferase
MCADWNQLFLDPAKVVRNPDPLVVEFAREQAPHARILDLGCGGGRHLIYLNRLGFRLVGTDIAPRGLELSRQWLISESLYADLLLAPMLPLPLAANSFDGAISINVLNHATIGETTHAVADVQRVLRPGAPFFFIVIGREDARGGEGQEIEPFTFIHAQGIEAGVPHHYYDKEEVEQLVAPFQRKIISERRKPYDDKDSLWGNDPRAQARRNPIFQHWLVQAWK